MVIKKTKTIPKDKLEEFERAREAYKAELSQLRQKYMPIFMNILSEENDDEKAARSDN